MFDCHLEVAGHSGRKLEALLVQALYPLMLRVQTREGVFGVRAKRWYPHQADELQPLRRLSLCTQLVDEVGPGDVDAPAVGVAVEAELDVDAQRLPTRLLGERIGRRPVQRGDQPGA